MTSTEGNESEVQRLLTAGANLNATDENGNSALLLAAGKGNLYKFKVKWGEKHTKLHRKKLANSGSESLVKLLIENGADINAVDKENNTALIIAINNGKIIQM